MKRISAVVILICCVLFIAGTALAVPPGMTLTFPSKMGPVVFSGAIHAKAGLKCSACHPKIFQMVPVKSGAKITMKKIWAGQLCGHCHNGKVAFSAKDPKNCSKCHQVKK